MKKPQTSAADSSHARFDDSEELESSSEDEEEIERELADVTLEDLQKARSDGSQAVLRLRKPEKKTGRANKNRPMEASSKKAVSRFREVIQTPKKVIRDPRFEPLCGALNLEGFKKRYDFLYEDTLPAEKAELQKKLKKTKDPMAIDDLKKHISWVDKQLKSGPVKRPDAVILAEHKKKEREAAKQGKQPFYLKASDIRKQKLIIQYNNLKDSGKLESFIEKKRKKNASKDHRYMPYRRLNIEQQN